MIEPNSEAGPLRSEFADDPDMAELVREFVEHLPERMRALEEAWRSANVESAARLAHQLKGASAGYGFTPVGEAAARLERAIRDSSEDLESARGELEQLVALCRRATAR